MQQQTCSFSSLMALVLLLFWFFSNKCPCFLFLKPAPHLAPPPPLSPNPQTKQATRHHALATRLLLPFMSIHLLFVASLFLHLEARDTLGPCAVQHPSYLSILSVYPSTLLPIIPSPAGSRRGRPTTGTPPPSPRSRACAPDDDDDDADVFPFHNNKVDDDQNVSFDDDGVFPFNNNKVDD